MAQLTYDPTPADQPEFNEAEQEAAQQDAMNMELAKQAGQFASAPLADPSKNPNLAEGLNDNADFSAEADSIPETAGA